MNLSLRATAKQSHGRDCGACSERSEESANSLLRLCLATVPPRNDNFLLAFTICLPIHGFDNISNRFLIFDLTSSGGVRKVSPLFLNFISSSFVSVNFYR